MLPAINVRFRLRTMALTLILVTLATFLVYLRHNWLYPETGETFDPIKARKQFANPVYQKWAATDRLQKSLQDNCVQYFNEFQAWTKKDASSLQDLLQYQFSPLIYKKSRWIAEEKKHYRRKLRQQGITMDESHLQVLDQRFYEDCKVLHQFEKTFVENSASLRVFGRCYTERKFSFDDSSCSHISSKLLPWLLGKLPSVESWESNVVKEDEARQCVVNLLEKKMKGRGIVIPLLPQTSSGNLVILAARLIQVLRATQNTLPIEIVYVEEGELSKQKKGMLVSAARSRLPKLPNSLKDYVEEYDIQLHLDFPPQEIRFVNLRPSIAESVTVTDNLAWIFSMLFNSFEEMIVLSVHTIPLLENLQSLFDGEEYQQTGTFFFKQRSLLSFRPHKFPPGFFEVNTLVNEYGSPLGDDNKYFQLGRTESVSTKRVREKGFSKLLDPSMVVLNKRKTLGGLLLASSLPFYKFLLPKYDVTSFNPDLLWLGIEMAAGKVHFNRHHAAAPGVLTPPENTPMESTSKELCSSSWAQLHEDNDFTLIYVTSHQLENRVLPDFAPAVIDKVSIKSKEGDKKMGENGDNSKATDEQLAQQTLKKNLLYIKSVLQPAVIDQQVDIYKNNEPVSAWSHVEGFGSSNDFWCAYNVVGDVSRPVRGLVIDYNPKIIARTLFLVDMWLLTPQAYQNPTLGD